MSKKYATTGSMALIAADTVLSVIAASTVRPCIYDIVCSSSSTPADYSAEFLLQRMTAAGTGTATTPVPLDPADPASISTSKHTYTAEPTITASTVLLRLCHNQRATVRWVAAPGSEIYAPATAANGLVFTCNAVSTQFTEAVTILFAE